LRLRLAEPKKIKATSHQCVGLLCTDIAGQQRRTIGRQRHNLPTSVITNQTGLTRKEAEAVARAFDAGDIEQVYREVFLAGILELTEAKLRSDENWDDGTIADVFRKITTAR